MKSNELLTVILAGIFAAIVVIFECGVFNIYNEFVIVASILFTYALVFFLAGLIKKNSLIKWLKEFF